MAWRKRSSASLQTLPLATSSSTHCRLVIFGQEVLDEIVAFHMDAVKADIADFAFEFADVFDTAAQVAA